METIRVTQITLVYNTGERILPTLDSIRLQTHPDIEHIIVDDGSTDNSVELIRQWVDHHQYKCQILVNQKNVGICKSINNALRVSTGRYISIIGDDIMMRDKLERDVACLEKNPSAAFCYSNMIVRDMDSGAETPLFTSHHRDVFSKMLEGTFVHTTPSVTYRRSAHDKVGLYDESLSFEDLDMQLRMTREFPVVHLPVFSVIYCRYKSNFHTGVAPLRFFQEVERIIKKWEAAPNYRYHKAVRRQLIFDYYADKDKKTALQFLPSALIPFWRMRLYKSMIKFVARW